MPVYPGSILPRAIYDELEANHQPVKSHVYPDQGHHSRTVLASLPDSTPFLRSVFDPH